MDDEIYTGLKSLAHNIRKNMAQEKKTKRPNIRHWHSEQAIRNSDLVKSSRDEQEVG